MRFPLLEVSLLHSNTQARANLVLGKTEGRRRRGQQRMRWSDGIISSVDMSLSKLKQRTAVKPGTTVHVVAKGQTQLNS